MEIDGLDNQWEAGIPSDWEGELGNLDPDNVQAYASNFALQHLHVIPGATDLRCHDTSGVGQANDTDVDAADLAEEQDPNELATVTQATVNGVRVVRKLSLQYFRDKLVDRFDIMFTQHKLVWPS